MPKTSPPPNLIGISEASKITGLDRRTLHRMIQRGDLPAEAKLPGLRGSYILRRSDVEALARGAA